MTEAERELLIEEARQRLEACLQTKLCNPLVPTWIVWGCLLFAFALALYPISRFPAGSLELGLIGFAGFALTITGLFLWEARFFSQICRVQRWKEAFESFYRRHRDFDLSLFFIGLPVILWWPFERPFPPLPQLWRIMGLELYLFALYAVQELQKFSLDNPEIIRGLQVSLLKPQTEVLNCAQQVIAGYSLIEREQLVSQIEIQFSALEGLTLPWTIGIGIAADRLISLLSQAIPSSLAFTLVVALALGILLKLTNRVYNYVAIAQAVIQLKDKEQSSSDLKENSYDQ